MNNPDNPYLKALSFSLLFIVGLVFVQFVAFTLLTLIRPEISVAPDKLLEPELMLALAWFSSIFILPLTFGFYFIIDKLKWENITSVINLRNIFINVSLSMLLAVVFFAFYIGILYYFDFLQLKIRKPERILSIILFGIFSGVTEEIAIRGYLLNLFIRNKKYITGIFWTSLFFSGLHVFNPGINMLSLFNIFMVGVFLALVTIYTGNLFFSIFFHVIFNFLDLFLGFNLLLTDNDYSLFSVGLVKENLFLTGGDAGITGSLILTGLLFISILVASGLLAKIKMVTKMK